jgi:hypothetical protein
VTNDDRQRHVRALAIDALRRRGANVRPGPDDAPGDDHLIDQAGAQMVCFYHSCAYFAYSHHSQLCLGVGLD